MIFQNEKKTLQAKKKTNSKSQKIDIFPKGLSHGFGPKKPPLFQLFLRQYKKGKCLYDIVERKNAFLGYKNKKIKE